KADHTVPGVGYVLEEPPRPGRFNKKRALGMGIPEGPMFSRLQRGEEVVLEGKTFRSEDVLGPPRPGRKIVFTGDTRPISPMPQSWKECDVMVHEATFANDMEARAIEYGHATAGHAAQAAKDAGALRLFMVHRSPRYKDPALLLEEARKIFPETYAPADLEEYEVPLRK
ncbi:MAG: MBL fold metallo-hydrolase, partial [Candidatus Thermoplasmatota archaeon]|nr:MBL fold metallo-hydrolase [Candidatus Thermoplasmatota archaeon]